MTSQLSKSQANFIARKMEMEIAFQEFKNTVSSDGCSDDLAVCNSHAMKFFNFKMTKASKALSAFIESDFDSVDESDIFVFGQITDNTAKLIESFDNTGCDEPYGVIEKQYVDTLSFYIDKC